MQCTEHIRYCIIQYLMPCVCCFMHFMDVEDLEQEICLPSNFDTKSSAEIIEWQDSRVNEDRFFDKEYDIFTACATLYVIKTIQRTTGPQLQRKDDSDVIIVKKLMHMQDPFKLMKKGFTTFTLQRHPKNQRTRTRIICKIIC